MHTAKKTCLLLLALLLSVTVITPPVFASITASDYINSYSTSLHQGNYNGQLKIEYDIIGKGTMDTIGVSKIVVYKADGTKVRTIWGSVVNGLLEQNTFSADGSYYFSVVAGLSYYCHVTFYSGKNGGYDTRTVQTGTVVAPVIPSP